MPEQSTIYQKSPSRKFKKKKKNESFEFHDQIFMEMSSQSSRINHSFEQFTSGRNQLDLEDKMEKEEDLNGYKLIDVKDPIKYGIVVYREVTPKSEEKFKEDIYDPNYQAKGNTIKHFKLERRFRDFYLFFSKIQELSEYFYIPLLGNKASFLDYFKRNNEHFYMKRKVYLQIFLQQILIYQSYLRQFKFFTDFFDHVCLSL